MRSIRTWAAAASLGLGVFALTAMGGVPSASASVTTPPPSATVLAGTAAPASELAHPAGAVASSSAVSFDLVLQLPNASAAQAMAQQVSSPGSAQYRHYLTDAEWIAQYAPSQAEVSAAKAWLVQEGFSVGAVPSDRLYVPAQGTVAQVENAFATTLGNYLVNGETVRLASGALSVPASIAGTVSGVVGVNQYLATPDIAAQAPTAVSAPAASPAQEPPPPAGFRNPQPCSAYWGQKIDTSDSPKLYKPYTAPLPYDICGYLPGQLRSAYGIGATNTGAGVALAIVDAYDSPTVLSDAQEYFSLNDPTQPLTNSQFVDVPPATVDDVAECGGSGWLTEQALDVESSHSMAPSATIEFVGAQDCQDNSLLAALQTAVTSGVSVVSDSWGDTGGDLFTDAATKSAYDEVFMLADTTGVSVLFSSGDSGDNFAALGTAVPDYPPSSPFVTAVGGTSLEVGSKGARTNEFGWSTGSQLLCADVPSTSCPGKKPAGALTYQVGGGGGTSYYYTQPYYQANVVPSDLALRNEALFGPVPLRVEPDIAMDADAQTGMLIGLTQTFPDGVYYDQFKEGGTSLASPLLAGVVADADQAAGVSLGFLNPTLYKAYSEYPAAFNDIVPPHNPLSAATIRVNFADSVDTADGYTLFLRVFDYEGPETYCDGTGNCATRDVTLTTGQGFDSMTGLGSVGPQFISSMAKF